MSIDLPLIYDISLPFYFDQSFIVFPQNAFRLIATFSVSDPLSLI